MKLLNTLEDRFGRFAVPQLTLIVIICQILVYGMHYGQRVRDPEGLTVVERLDLIPEKVLEGEVWRLFTFVAIPPVTNVVFALFCWYLFYLMGTALEEHWGTFRYNVFLLVGFLATVGVSFLTPEQPASAAFWQGSVFLAFAYLCPYFVLHIFFILPVQIRWLAMLTWIGYGLGALFGTWETRFVILASVSNYLLFFGKEIVERMIGGRRHMASQASRFGAEGKQPAYFHRCLVCGITDRSHPRAEFRYCSKCPGSCCYCLEHLKAHEHVIGDVIESS